MDKQLTCSSCNVSVANLSGSVTFKCPKCSQSEITRCTHCRKIVAQYTCPSCSFKGPN